MFATLWLILDHCGSILTPFCILVHVGSIVAQFCIPKHSRNAPDTPGASQGQSTLQMGNLWALILEAKSTKSGNKCVFERSFFRASFFLDFWVAPGAPREGLICNPYTPAWSKHTSPFSEFARKKLLKGLQKGSKRDPLRAPLGGYGGPYRVPAWYP